jgi:hypothetical protein
MTQKTHKRAKGKFEMKVIRKRAKKAIRKRFKKNIKLSKVDDVWRDWLDIMIVEPLLRGQKVQLDKHFSLEITGKLLSDDKRALSLMSKGYIASGNGRTKKADKMNRTRMGVIYGIRMTETRFKEGQLIFTAHPSIKKRVNEALNNTNTYYRIEK